MTITTNHRLRPIIMGYELSPAEAASFDYLAEDELPHAMFFRYRGEVYDMNEFTVIRPNCDDELSTWDAIRTDTVFSATVIRLVDQDYVVVGAAFC